MSDQTGRIESVDAIAWHDEPNDIYNVKLCVRILNSDGTHCKKGLMFRITDEMLRYVAEGARYPEKELYPESCTIEE